MQTSNTRTSQKLAYFKAKAEQAAKNNPHASEDYKNWRWHARHAFRFGPGYTRCGISEGFHELIGKSGKPIRTGLKFKNLWFHCDARDIPGFRSVGYCDELRKSINHKGWFTDNVQYETVRGIVGVFRWGRDVWIVPGVEYSDADCDYFDLTQAEKMYPHEAFWESGDWKRALVDIVQDVALTADRLAESTAEVDREAFIKDRAEQMVENLADAIVKTRAETRALVHEIRKAGKAFAPAICQALREKLEEKRQHIRACRKAIDTVKSEHWRYDEFYGLV